MSRLVSYVSYNMSYLLAPRPVCILSISGLISRVPCLASWVSYFVFPTSRLLFYVSSLFYASYLVSPISYISCLMSCLVFRVSCLLSRNLVLWFVSLVSHLLMPRVRCPVSHVSRLMSRISCPLSRIWCHVSGVSYLPCPISCLVSR